MLSHAGSVSHDAAAAQPSAEYARWRHQTAALPEPVDLDFEDAIRQTRSIEKTRAPRRARKDSP